MSWGASRAPCGSAGPPSRSGGGGEGGPPSGPRVAHGSSAVTGPRVLGSSLDHSSQLPPHPAASAPAIRQPTKHRVLMHAAPYAGEPGRQAALGSSSTTASAPRSISSSVRYG